jgi:hypothetical protein
MIRRRTRISYPLAIGILGAVAISLPACGDTGVDGGQTTPPDGTDKDGGTHHPGDDGGVNVGPDGGGSPDGNNHQGDDDAGHPPPPVQCGGDTTDATAATLDFANNQIPSPAPPGNLDPKNAPQIVVFGWDDVESDVGINFVNSLLGSIKNPNGSKGSCNLNPNSCYGVGWSGDIPGYVCGDGTLGNATSRGKLTINKFDIGNHTTDHLESNSTWTGIPAAYKDPATGSWKFTADGYGPGIVLDQKNWQDILTANDQQLKTIYKATKIAGFRAPRLEVNDNGLNALKAIGYQYDENLEELLPAGHVDAIVDLDTGAKEGFSGFPWPYTLDNGSPGIWIQQVDGDKKWVTNFPKSVWEIPVYQVYVPSKNGLGKTIADTMMAADKDCTFPPGTPTDQQTHCFLSDGELNPGDSVKEVTSFDFNTFIYSRFSAAQWLEVMKHTFLARYYGNRAPLTYGAHPIEYTDPYDSYTLSQQANNYGYKNVLKYNKYTDRQQAMTDFVKWIQGDPALSKETYFMSAQQLVDYMKNPIDKTGAKVTADAVATPDSNGLFSRLGWTGQGATINVVDGNTADIVFTVAAPDDAPVSVSAGLNAGSLKGVSHIDIKYTTEVPFRIRLETSDGSLSRTVLLAGVGGERLARIRVKDFFPSEDASASLAKSAGLVDAAYMAKVSGISIESAATAVTGAKAFKTHIDQITLHGVATADLCGQ